jgi:hypothetical protein
MACGQYGALHSDLSNRSSDHSRDFVASHKASESPVVNFGRAEAFCGTRTAATASVLELVHFLWKRDPAAEYFLRTLWS